MAIASARPRSAAGTPAVSTGARIRARGTRSRATAPDAVSTMPLSRRTWSWETAGPCSTRVRTTAGTTTSASTGPATTE